MIARTTVPYWLRGTTTLLSIAALLPAWFGCGSDDGSSTNETETGGETLKLSYAGDDATVALDKLDTRTVKGMDVVTLKSVWNAGKFGVDITSVSLDFEGDDGFRPSQKDKCAEPLGGETLLSGYIAPDTRNLIWDDGLGLPGCYSVSGVALIEASTLSEE